jgi:hypothetical protein
LLGDVALRAHSEAWYATANRAAEDLRRGDVEREAMHAALSVALADLSTGAPSAHEAEKRGPIVEAAPPIVAAWLEESRRFPNSGQRSLEVWLAESIDRLDAEVRRMGGQRG